MPVDHLEEPVGAWCPVCRSAYRPGFTRCAGCDVDLVEELPPLPPRRRFDGDPEDAVEYDLTDWSDDQRDGLELHLRVGEIVREWDGATLRVPLNEESEVDALIDEIDAGTYLALPGDPLPLPVLEPRPPQLASRWRRFAGYVLDVAASFAVFMAYASSDGWTTGGFLVVTLFATLANHVVAVALWGRSIGKLLIGTKIVRANSFEPIGWWRAIVRWLVESPPLPIVNPEWIGRFALGTIWPIAIYLGVLVRRDRRGLHDFAAGTVVIRTR